MAKFVKKRTYKKRKAPGRLATYSAAGSQLYKDVKMLKNLINVEKKEFPYSHSASVDNVSSAAFQMAPIANGLLNGNRIGDSVKFQALHLRGYITKSSVPTTTRVRLILFQGKSERTGGYTISNDLLQQVGTQPLIDGNKNELKKYNTKFLLDKIYTLDSAKTNIINLEWKFKLGWHCNYVPQQTTIEDGGLYIAWISDQTGTSKPFVNVTYEVVYTDD